MIVQNSLLIAAIVAIAENRVMGKNNQLPWHLSTDLKHFKAITTGHAILMGRKTYESIAKILPYRTNLIMTHDPKYSVHDAIIVHSVQEALLWASSHPIEKLFIIGGAEVYQQWLPYIKQIYLTIVHHTFEGDTYFPLLDMQQWEEISREDFPANEKNPYAFSFLVLEKRESQIANHFRAP